MQQHHLSEADDGKVVSVQTGDLVDVRLHEMPSGGYRWLVDSRSGDVLDRLDEQVDFAEGRVGGVNEICFRFRVKAAGTETIRFSYRRPWAADEPPLRTYQATVEAR